MEGGRGGGEGVRGVRGGNKPQEEGCGCTLLLYNYVYMTVVMFPNFSRDDKINSKETGGKNRRKRLIIIPNSLLSVMVW